MRRSSATAVPVVRDPHPEPVRAAVRELIRAWAPVELQNLKVEQLDSDWHRITASTPNGVTVHQDVTL